MNNTFAALGSAFASYLGSAGTVPVYGLQAPQGSAHPYVLFQTLTNVQEYTFTSDALAADCIVKVVSDRTYPDDEAYPLWTHIGAAMQNAELVIPGYRLKRCEARSAVEYQDSDKYWHVGYMYRIEAHAE